LVRIGEEIGSDHAFRQAALANRHTPELKAFDSRGHRTDQVDFHPSRHRWMRYVKKTGIISAPFEGQEEGCRSYFAAGFFLMSQVEADSSAHLIQ
jgi:putative acyl-CoA dehydrogenase